MLNAFIHRHWRRMGLLLIAVLFIVTPMHANEYRFTSKLSGEQRTWTSKQTEIVVKFVADTEVSQMRDFAEQYGLSRLSREGEFLELPPYAVFGLPEGQSFETIKTQLVQDSLIVGISPVLIHPEGSKYYYDPEMFVVQFADHVSDEEARRIIKEWQSEIVSASRFSRTFRVTVPSDMNVFQAVRTFMVWSEVKFTEPAFTFVRLTVHNDTYLADQWHLKNTGQIQTPIPYIEGHDINAFPAWDITFGDSDVVIVIIDTGIDLTHPDLEDNIVPRGNEDWDFSSSNEAPVDSSGHGTAVAGIAAAIKNTIGVRGVAPECRIMPLKIPVGEIEDVENVVDAINYAVNRAGDFTRMVINCSWGVDTFHVQEIQTAVQNAVNNNIPIFFSAGNEGTNPVNYPARYAETIAVGSMWPVAVARAPESNYGENLDLAAPGMRIYTTDIQGSAGYNSDNPFPGDELEDEDYTRLFRNTSSAAPMAAATAALMLSVNPSLSVSEVRTILQQTADKVGGYNYNWSQSKPGHSIELGYGRVNAHKAVSAAKPMAVLTAEPQKLSLRVTWAASSNVSSYFVRYGTDSLNLAQSAEVDSTELSYVIESLTNDLQYYVRVNGSDLFTNLPSPCRTDYDSSNTVDFPDFLRFSEAWGTTPDSAGYQQRYDLSGNRKVDEPDSAIFVGDYGKTCEQLPKPAMPLIVATGKNHAAQPDLVIQQAGDEVLVDIRVDHVSELAGYEAVLHYDARVLEYVGQTDQGGLLVQQDEDGAFGFVKNAGDLVFVVSSLRRGHSPVEGSGNLARVVFRKRGDVVEDAPVSLYNLSLSDGDFVVDRLIASGYVTHPQPEPEMQWVTNLGQNVPNPFNPSTIIAFTLADAGSVNLVVYNALGQEVRRLVNGEQMSAGPHRVVWDGRDAQNRAVSSGVYIYRMQAGDFEGVQRMVMLK